MAYDGETGGDPRGPWRPKCGRPIRALDRSTIMHFGNDPYGKLGLSGRPWHGDCARPYWDTYSTLLEGLTVWWGI
jgi:hypothetical protein